MKGFFDRLQGAPGGVLFAFLAGFYFVGTYTLNILSGTVKLSVQSALISLVGAAVFGGLMTWWVSWQRRRHGGRTVVAQMGQAMKTGVLPDSAERGVWVPALQARRRQNHRARWLSPVIFGLFALAGALLIIQDPANVVPWVVTVFFVGFVVFSVIQVPKTIKTIDGLLAQLEPTSRSDVDTQL